MFCFQCQEAARNVGCDTIGVCGKEPEVANLQDLLIYTIKGLCYVCEKSNYLDNKVMDYIPKALFVTITNVNFDKDDVINYIKKGIELREEIIEKTNLNKEELPECAKFICKDEKEMLEFAKPEVVGVLSEKDEDIRALKELITYGIKGIGAYLTHAMRLNYNNEEIHKFIIRAFTKLVDSKDADELFNLALETGKYAVETLALLDKANTETYGHPEITEVSLEVGNNPGILITGHDLKDLEELLEQTKGTGVDVYTHCEMLPAHYYPFFKKYEHFKGNYGNAWWKQKEEFEKFNGPIVVTTNCLVPPKDSYKDRVYVTNEVGYPGLKRIPEKDGKKDFSEVIEHAKKCPPPTPLESGKIIGGFAHNQVLALADKIIEAIKAGKIRKFVVVAGCDGRHRTREYYTEFVKKLPKDVVVLTCGCAKYRFIKLDLGDIDGIPRVLDAGQCNDSYSLAVVALKLKEVLGLEDINDLPIAYNISWYEQKAVAVLLALLYLGVKNIVLGPTLPAFLSENIIKVLVEKFGISQISTVDEDIKRLVG
ncbi:hydroxylamine reductase [Methanocaldococcus indicus]|uniref:hydroxylamine reductase n=1 Tax=Methanocaldococcus indicus TaxID=213231 RepID=UPI003C6D817F